MLGWAAPEQVGRRVGPQADASGEWGSFCSLDLDAQTRGLRLCQGYRASMWIPTWKVPSRSFLSGKH